MTMTEKEKAQQGLLYDNNNDPQLVNERLEAKELCYDYNQLRPRMISEREAIMKNFWRKREKSFGSNSPFIVIKDTTLR